MTPVKWKTRELILSPAPKKPLLLVYFRIYGIDYTTKFFLSLY